jgi:hypothetical protein
MAVRMEKTRSFLQLFRPDLEYEIVPLRDVYGPTGWDPNIQALVVSMETLPGAASSGYLDGFLESFTDTLIQLTTNAPPSHYLPSVHSSSTLFLQKAKS